MFGLMKRAERLAYCGSCKTIGAMYGQRARLLLNHDLVFLAELLMENGKPEWGAAHKSFNCMAMPKEHPPALKYAATAAVVLAHFQFEDQIADSGRWRWSAAKRFFSPAYRKAAAELRRVGFPLDKLAEFLASQKQREARGVSFGGCRGTNGGCYGNGLRARSRAPGIDWAEVWVSRLRARCLGGSGQRREVGRL